MWLQKFGKSLPLNTIVVLDSSALKSRISEHLIVEDNDSVKYRIAFTLDRGAEVNVLPKTFYDKMC